MDVDFDNLSIIQSVSRMVEINDYYPYGLLNPALSVRPDPAMANDRKFQGKRLISDVNTSSDYFGWREYDPLLGRWHVADPAEQFANPYLAMGNTPSMFVDYDGAAGGVISNIGSNGGDLAGSYSPGGKPGDWMGSSFGGGGGYIDGMHMSRSMLGLALGNKEFKGMIDQRNSSDGQGVTFGGLCAYDANGSVIGITLTGVDANGNSIAGGYVQAEPLGNNYSEGISSWRNPVTGGMVTTELGIAALGLWTPLNAGGSWTSTANDVGFTFGLTSGLYGEAARGLTRTTSTVASEIQAARVIGGVASGAKYLGWAGNVVGIAANTYDVVYNPTASNVAHLTINGLAISANLLNLVVPGLGTVVSIGISTADVAGGFDWLYNSLGEPKRHK